MHWKKCINRVLLWNKKVHDFVPVIPNVNVRGYEMRCINPEQLNLNGMIVRFAYMPLEKVMEHGNDTGLAGFYGDIWNLIGSYLNFTILAENSDIHHHNTLLRYGVNYMNVQLMKSNKTDIAAPMNYDSTFLGILGYLTLTSTCSGLYIPASFESDDTWFLKMITYDILLIILAFMILISMLSCFIDRYRTGYQNMNSPLVSFCDHFFYTFATFTNQGSSTPFHAENHARMLAITKKMLAWLFLIMSTGNLFYLMSRVETDAPFTDIPSLMDKSNMQLMIPLLSTGWQESMKKIGTLCKEVSLQKLLCCRENNNMNISVLHTRISQKRLSKSVINSRIKFPASYEALYEELCQNHTKAAIWQNDLTQRTVGREYNCNFVSFNPCLTRQSVVVGISKSFQYKRSLMIGIMKVRESGLMGIIERRWIEDHLPFIPEQYRDVTWKDVKIIFLIYLVGVVLSIIVLMIENIYFIYKRRRMWIKWNRQLRRIAEHLRSQP